MVGIFGGILCIIRRRCEGWEIGRKVSKGGGGGNEVSHF